MATVLKTLSTVVGIVLCAFLFSTRADATEYYDGYVYYAAASCHDAIGNDIQFGYDAFWNYDDSTYSIIACPLIGIRHTFSETGTTVYDFDLLQTADYLSSWHFCGEDQFNDTDGSTYYDLSGLLCFHSATGDSTAISCSSVASRISTEGAGCKSSSSLPGSYRSTNSRMSIDIAIPKVDTYECASNCESYVTGYGGYFDKN